MRIEKCNGIFIKTDDNVTAQEIERLVLLGYDIQTLKEIYPNTTVMVSEDYIDKYYSHPITVRVCEDCDVRPMESPNDIVATKFSAIESIKKRILFENVWLVNYAEYDKIATYFASLYTEYSDHDKRDLEIKLNYDWKHNDKIQWAIFAPDEIVASGELLLDRCTINPNTSEEI